MAMRRQNPRNHPLRMTKVRHDLHLVLQWFLIECGGTGGLGKCKQAGNPYTIAFS